MKKFLLFILLHAAMTVSLPAQEIIGTAYLECKYKYYCNTDTLSAEKNAERDKWRSSVSEDQMVLLIGKEASAFYSYYTARYDSICTVEKERNKADPMAVVYIIHEKKLPKGNSWRIYKNYPAGKLTYTDRILDYYKYEEEYAPQPWEIKGDTTTVLGYTCQMATCNFRGRNYTAWFTTEIPVSEGPWKFNGLPGLIMKVEDASRHYSFEIIGIRQVTDTPICFQEQKYIKVSRKEFMKHNKKFLDDPVGFINNNSGGKIKITPTNGTKDNDLLAPKKIGYDFLEKDYR